jgi:hypothetical protein
MDPLHLFGYAGAILVGISLGLLGGGGSILTVPVMVYLLEVEPVLATAYSLFVVGLASLIGSFRFLQQGLVSLKTALVFAIPAFLAVFATRKFIVPAIPDHIFTLAGFELSKPMLIMIFFGLVMLAASISMIRPSKAQREGAAGETAEPKFNIPAILLEGAVVGGVTGLVGAGGGFLIVPALVLLARLPMKLAVGTSLLIIAAKSLIGFLGDIAEQDLSWGFLAVFTGLTIVGIFGGNYLARYVDGNKLKTGFGYFVLVMGLLTIVLEITQGGAAGGH